MRWHLAYGDEETQRLIKVMKEDGLTHQALSTKPAPLEDHHLDVYAVFQSLSASREWSQVGPQAFKTTEVEAEFRLRGVDDHYERLKYLRICRRLDRIELDHHYDRLKKVK